MAEPVESKPHNGVLQSGYGHPGMPMRQLSDQMGLVCPNITERARHRTCSMDWLRLGEDGAR